MNPSNRLMTVGGILLFVVALALIGCATLNAPRAGAQDAEDPEPIYQAKDATLPDGRTTFPGFRGPCYHVVTEDRDPLRPESHHNHAFEGVREFSANPTVDAMLAAPTTCERPTQHDMYWFPTLTVNGVEITKPDFMGVYWQAIQNLDSRKTRPIPDRFGMIASDDLGDVSWACTTSQNAGNVTPNLPDCDPGQGLGLRITFAPCWDGQPPNENGVHTVEEAIRRADGTRSCRDGWVQLPVQTLWPDFRNVPWKAGPDEITVSTGAGVQSPVSMMHADSITAFEGDATNTNSMEDLVATCIRPFNTDAEFRDARPGRCDGNVFFD